jgi:DNA-directed RNA polymerase specialized sigma24 family protein
LARHGVISCSQSDLEANVADRTEFDEFVAARSPHLLRLAYLLTRNVSTAQDLLQDAPQELVRLAQDHHGSPVVRQEGPR